MSKVMYILNDQQTTKCNCCITGCATGADGFISRVLLALVRVCGLFVSMIFWNKIRRLIREVFPPIPKPLASKWERRLRYLYIFSAWNMLGGVAFMFYRKPELAVERGGPHTSPAEYWAKAFDAQNATFVKFVGLNPKPIVWQQGDNGPDSPAEERQEGQVDEPLDDSVSP